MVTLVTSGVVPLAHPLDYSFRKYNLPEIDVKDGLGQIIVFMCYWIYTNLLCF